MRWRVPPVSRPAKAGTGSEAVAFLPFQDSTRPCAVFLHGQPWFGQLPEDARRRVSEQVSVLRGSKGDVMLRSGEEVKGWYAVLSGLVKLQSESAQGRRQGFLGIPAASGSAKARC